MGFFVVRMKIVKVIIFICEPRVLSDLCISILWTFLKCFSIGIFFFVFKETQKRIMIEKKFNYDSKDDIVPLGIVHENQSNSKKIVPATLAKAQEKAIEKRKSSTPKFNELWQSRENILKSISKKGTPKMDDSTNVFDENKENIFNNETKLTILSSVSTPQNEIQAVPTGSSSQQKYRKVSFKEETETIPECKIDGTILEEEPSDPMEKEVTIFVFF